LQPIFGFTPLRQSDILAFLSIRFATCTSRSLFPRPPGRRPLRWRSDLTAALAEFGAVAAALEKAAAGD